MDVSRDVARLRKILEKRFSSRPLTVRCYSEVEAGSIAEHLSEDERAQVVFNWLEPAESGLLDSLLNAPLNGQAVLA